MRIEGWKKRVGSNVFPSLVGEKTDIFLDIYDFRSLICLSGDGNFLTRFDYNITNDITKDLRG